MRVNTSQQPKKAFLSAFARSGSVTEAAANVGMDRGTHYLWMKNEEYRIKFQAAQDEAARELEDEAVKRAKTGSDTLLIFLLKCRNRPVFGDRQELSGPNGTPLYESREQADKALTEYNSAKEKES